MTKHPSPRHCIFIFIDGLGLGPADPNINPLAAMPLPGLKHLAGGQDWTMDAAPLQSPTHVFKHIDATLGHPGLPQSGTGQASLFTGIDCVELVGRHFGPYPHSRTKEVLSSQNIFQQLVPNQDSISRDAVFANAYPSIFFEHQRRRKRWTVTTYCSAEAGIRLRRAADLREGRAIAADITRRRWNHVGDDVPVVDSATAARHLYNLSQDHRISLFEYFLSDKAGHSQDMDSAQSVLTDLDAFLPALCEQLDVTRDLLVLTSDHGNIEDLSTKTHTRNAVPLLAIGAGAAVMQSASTIVDVLPALKEVMAVACSA